MQKITHNIAPHYFDCSGTVPSVLSVRFDLTGLAVRVTCTSDRQLSEAIELGMLIANVYDTTPLISAVEDETSALNCLLRSIYSLYEMGVWQYLTEGNRAFYMSAARRVFSAIPLRSYCFARDWAKLWITDTHRQAYHCSSVVERHAWIARTVERELDRGYVLHPEDVRREMERPVALNKHNVPLPEQTK